MAVEQNRLNLREERVILVDVAQRACTIATFGPLKCGIRREKVGASG
jgi:hypothetical protein